MDRNGWAHVVLAAGIAGVAVLTIGLVGQWYGWWEPLESLIGMREVRSLSSQMTADVASAANLLIDGDFEGGFRRIDGQRELEVAVGWTPWWGARSARPEWKDASATVDPRRVHAGSHAQQWFNNYRTHTGGIYQSLTGIQPGATLTLTAWAQAFSSGGDDFGHSDGRYRMRIGIDPYGGTDAESPDVAWSDGGNAIQPYDAYSVLRVACLARSDRATVFVWGQAEWALKHNDAYVDDVELVASAAPGPGCPTPVVCPTAVPTPLAPCPTGMPGAGPVSCPGIAEIRGVVREEIDKTRLGQ